MSFNFFHFRDRWTLFSNLWRIQFHKASLFCLTVPFVGSDPITFLAITAVETAQWLRRFIIWSLISLLAILFIKSLNYDNPLLLLSHFQILIWASHGASIRQPFYDWVAFLQAFDRLDCYNHSFSTALCKSGLQGTMLSCLYFVNSFSLFF